jgi:hypothetical protein
MCGAGSVALAPKWFGFQATASDISRRGQIIGSALVANDLTALSCHHISKLFKENGAHHGTRIQRPDQLRLSDWKFLTNAVAVADFQPEPIRGLLLLTLIKATLRLFPMSLPNATDAAAAASADYDRISPRRLGHYLNARSSLTPAWLWRVAQQVNGGVIGGQGAVERGDACDVITRVAPDVV